MKAITPIHHKKNPQTDYKSVLFWQSWGNCNTEAHSWRGVFNGPGKAGSVIEHQHLLRKGKSGCRSCRSESQAQANQLFPLSAIHISVPAGCGNPVHSCTCLERQNHVCWRAFCYHAAIKNKNTVKQFPFCSPFGSIK